MKGKVPFYKKCIIASTSLMAVFVIFMILFLIAIYNVPNTEIRRDIEPIQRRFPEIEHIESAVWLADSIGRTTFGPNTFWLEGYIELMTPMVGVEHIDDWVFVDDFVPQHLSTPIEMSDGDWFHSDTFDDEYGGEIMFATTFYRSSDEHKLYVFSVTD